MKNSFLIRKVNGISLSSIIYQIILMVPVFIAGIVFQTKPAFSCEAYRRTPVTEEGCKTLRLLGQVKYSEYKKVAFQYYERELLNFDGEFRKFVKQRKLMLAAYPKIIETLKMLRDQFKSEQSKALIEKLSNGSEYDSIESKILNEFWIPQVEKFARENKNKKNVVDLRVMSNGKVLVSIEDGYLPAFTPKQILDLDFPNALESINRAKVFYAPIKPMSEKEFVKRELPEECNNVNLDDTNSDLAHEKDLAIVESAVEAKLKEIRQAETPVQKQKPKTARSVK